jgi:hypothetical protein
MNTLLAVVDQFEFSGGILEMMKARLLSSS